MGKFLLYLLVVVMAGILAINIFHRVPQSMVFSTMTANEVEKMQTSTPMTDRILSTVAATENNISKRDRAENNDSFSPPRTGPGNSATNGSVDSETNPSSRKGGAEAENTYLQDRNESTEDNRSSRRIGVLVLSPAKSYDQFDGEKEEKQSLEKALERIGGEMGDPVFIRIFKKERTLEVWMEEDEKYRFLKQYPICSYSGELGPKLKEGDAQAPEGFYRVRREDLNPNSQYHLSMNIGFPNRYDRMHGRTGSLLMIHGGCVSIGCYAMGDEAIDEIYELTETALASGQPSVPVHIFPFRMTETNMDRQIENRWYDFWQNLKEGYDFFESNKSVPVVRVKEGRYSFSSPD